MIVAPLTFVHSLLFFRLQVSPDSQRIMYGVDRNGRDRFDLHVVDLQLGWQRPVQVQHKSIGWSCRYTPLPPVYFRPFTSPVFLVFFFLLIYPPHWRHTCTLFVALLCSPR
jgi:hypothetical protein